MNGLTRLSSQGEEFPYNASESLQGKSNGKISMRKFGCKPGFGKELEAESRTEKPTQVLWGIEHLPGRDFGNPDRAVEDTPIIHAGISNSNCDHAGNTMRQFINWEKIAKGRKKNSGKRFIVTFQLLVGFFKCLPYFYFEAQGNTSRGIRGISPEILPNSKQQVQNPFKSLIFGWIRRLLKVPSKPKHSMDK